MEKAGYLSISPLRSQFFSARVKMFLAKCTWNFEGSFASSRTFGRDVARINFNQQVNLIFNITALPLLFTVTAGNYRLPRQNSSTNFYSIFPLQPFRIIMYNNFIRLELSLDARNRNLFREVVQNIFVSINIDTMSGCHVFPPATLTSHFWSSLNWWHLSKFMARRRQISNKEEPYVHVAAGLDRSAFIIIFLAGLHARVHRSYSKIVHLNYESHRIRIKGRRFCSFQPGFG